MERLTVACVQQRLHVPATMDEYREALRRYLRVAANRHAGLVAFPELGGLMTVTPILDDLGSNLLKRVDRGRRRAASPWDKLVGSLAGGLARTLRSNLRRSTAGLLDVSAGVVWEQYVELFGGLAREFNTVVVAPSAYLPDPLDGVIRNLAAVFGGSGDLLGTQAKVVLHPSDADLAQPGTTWDVIQTDIGRIGLIIGGDVLYPEVGRLLAYQGAEVLVTQAACLDSTMYNKVRSGVLARMQDNQLFAAGSFLVGPNVFGDVTDSSYVGKSAIFAPQELTPRCNGVLVEMGGARSEGVVAAEWDFGALRELWESSDTPIRRTLSSAQVRSALGEIYARLQRLPAVAERPLIASTEDPVPSDHGRELVTLDELPVLGTHVDEWPPGAQQPEVDGPDNSKVHLPDPDDPGGLDAEDETDEYDSVQGPDEEGRA